MTKLTNISYEEMNKKTDKVEKGNIKSLMPSDIEFYM